MSPYSKRVIFAAISCVFVLLLLGATITNRFPLLRAYLQGPLDGGGYSLTNVGSVVLSSGGTVAGTVTNGYAAGTGINVYAGTSNSGALLTFNAITNADSSVAVSSNANTIKLAATNITEAKLLLADNTTANASASAHGFLPKLATTNAVLVNSGAAASWQYISNLLAAGTNITFRTTNGITTIHAAGGGGSGSVALTNTVWVSKNGSDATGERGDMGKAYLTLRAANTNALSGDTIFVMPGNYDEAGIVLKDKVDWHFAVGAEVVNTTNASPIFLDAANVTSRITGSGVFTNAAAGGYEVLYQSGTNSDIYFECLRASGGHASDFYYTIRSEAGALRVHGGVIVGWHYPAVLLSGTATAYFDGAVLDSTLNDQVSLGSGLVTSATNVVTLRNCTVLGSNDGSWGATTIYSVHATSAETVFIEGTLDANLPPNPNITYAGVDYAGLGEKHLAGNVSVTGNLSASGTLILSGTTNQVVFGAANTAPADTNTITQWISVQISGFTNQFRLPLYE